jgi:hypothetical protein
MEVWINFWLSENVGLEFGTTIKKIFGDRMTQLVSIASSYFQHTAGIVFKFEVKILMVMEYMTKMMLVQKFLV